MQYSTIFAVSTSTKDLDLDDVRDCLSSPGALETVEDIQDLLNEFEVNEFCDDNEVVVDDHQIHVDVDSETIEPDGRLQKKCSLRF